MKLDDTSLPGAVMESNEAPKKMTEYPFLFEDGGAIEEEGLGIRQIMVAGTCWTAAERYAVEAKCSAIGVKRLYHPSETGKADDVYYLVKTDNARFKLRNKMNASVWDYTIICKAEDPTLYVTGEEEVS